MRYRDKAVHARNPEVLVAGRRRLAIVAAVVLVVLLAVGGWFLARCLRSSQSQAGQGATTQMNVAKQKKHVVKKAEPKEHHGNSPTSGRLLPRCIFAMLEMLRKSEQRCPAL